MYPNTVLRPYSEEVDTKIVFRLQALWRGYLDRRHYSFQRELRIPKYQYFSKDELHERLTSQKISISLQDALKKESYKYKAGGIYVGQWLGGFRHGNGTMTWPDNSSYTGNWSYGYPCGQGVFKYFDNDTYKGKWSNIFALCNEQIQDGFVWLARKYENCNIIENNHSMMIKSLQEKFNDIETNLIEASQKLDSMFVHLKSQKTIEISNGITFQGDFINGKRQGYGKNIWENGDVYEGSWENDMQNGWGRNLWIDNSKYIGCYVNNQKHGIGEYNWDESTSYIGEWKENIIHGTGKYSWGDGRQYLGQWSEGMMSGFGIFTWKDGRRYEGFWSKGKKEGIGMSFMADGNSHVDLWLSGKIVKKN